jgi:acyl-CoA synthetase (AMP-forming)/AMP-acid ligase II
VYGLKHQKENRSMDHFAGLDVSVKETRVCIIDDTGRIVREAKVASEPDVLLAVLTKPAYHFKRIGLEAGPLSQWLFSALAEAGLPAICFETRHMRAVRGGWYRTGDLGCFDGEGNVHVVDRKKDMIISGGENVYSVKVENVLSTRPGVLECAVIGIPHDTWGEMVHAVVVKRDQQTVVEEELIAFCRGKIAGYKIPKSVSFSNEQLPKTGPGKIAKRRLRDTFWQGRDAKI